MPLCDGCGNVKPDVTVTLDGRAQVCDTCASFLDAEYTEDDDESISSAANS